MEAMRLNTGRMPVGFMLVIALLLAFGGAQAQNNQGEAEEWAASGEIRYDVLRGDGGLKLGEAEHRWQHEAGRYQMQTRLETTGLTAMLYDFSYVQHSEGRVVAGGLQPNSFRVEQRGREPEIARFDWDAGKVVIERRGRVREEVIAAGDQDVLSVWHLPGVMAGRALPESLSLVSNRRVSEATLSVDGKASIRLPAGTFDARKVTLRARSGRLTIEVWLADGHRHAPVRILMTDDKGEVLDLRAVEIAIAPGGDRTPKE